MSHYYLIDARFHHVTYVTGRLCILASRFLCPTGAVSLKPSQFGKSSKACWMGNHALPPAGLNLDPTNIIHD